jgi:hypothetical protein
VSCCIWPSKDGVFSYLEKTSCQADLSLVSPCCSHSVSLGLVALGIAIWSAVVGSHQPGLQGASNVSPGGGDLVSDRARPPCPGQKERRKKGKEWRMTGRVRKREAGVAQGGQRGTFALQFTWPLEALAGLPGPCGYPSPGPIGMSQWHKEGA